jgi:Ca-activated chloride channel family protein
MPPLKAVEVAKAKNVTIHTIGIGDPDATGEDKLDLATLKQIAASSGGQYFFGGNQQELAAIYDTLDSMTPEDQKVLTWRPRTELFHWPATAAAVLLGGYYLISGGVALVRRRVAI